MAINESGHHINVDNLDPLMERIKKAGTLYRPIKRTLLLTSIQGLYSQGKSLLKNIDDRFGTWKLVVNDRQGIFRKVNPLVARIIGNLYGMEVEHSMIKDAKELQAKMKSTRLTKPKDKDIENDLDLDETKHSVSQQSFNSVLKNFSAFLALLQQTKGYQTNIPDLTLAALQDFEKELQKANNDMNIASAELTKARIDRNLFLYTPETGLVDTALSVKNYMKAVYGATHPIYLDIKKIRFRNFR